MLKKKNGFTLIELLVVVAIISVLIALMMPALGSAREQAKTVSCQSNLRQIGIAFFSYGQEYNDSMVRWGVGTWSRPGTYRNQSTLPEWQRSDLWVDSSYSYGTYISYMELAMPYLGNKKIWHCSVKKPNDLIVYYGYNLMLSGISQGTWTTGNVNFAPPRMSSIGRPSDCVMVLDYSTWGWYANPIDFTGWLAVPPEDRIFAHKNCTNIVHVDGHVKSVVRYESFYSSGGMDSNGTYLNQAWNPYLN